MPRGDPGRLNRYGDSMIRSPAGWGEWLVRVECAIVRMLDGGVARLNSGMTHCARSDASAAKGKAVRFR